MNWLSAKKVRVHGIESRRWTRQDKIVQHKGLVSLYHRDRKIQVADEHVECKKQNIYLKRLQNEIKENREELGEAINANQQLIRNALADHRNLQLVYQHTHPTKIIENLYQENFNKRKCVDRLKYRLTKKTQTLIDLKLELARLEDALKYPSDANKSMLQMEETSEFVTGKVQSTTLKKEAALAVRSTYENILSILKKDSRYFDAVLRTLTMDTKTQNTCMIRTTELGQMATEYLDDRKAEYDELLRTVKRDRRSRVKTLKIFRKEYELLHDNLGKSLRKEDDITVGKVVIPQTREEARLARELKKISTIFDALQSTTHACDFDEIFPVIHDQEMNSIKLEELLRKYQQYRNSLSTKKDHAEVMETDVINTMVKSTNQYIVSHKQLRESIEREKKRKKHLFDKLHRNRDILLSARKALQDVLSETECIIPVFQEKSQKRETDADRTVQIIDSLHLKPSILESKSDSLHPKPSILASKTKLILKLLEPRLATLMKHEARKLSESETIQIMKLLEAENKYIFGLPAELLPAQRDVFDITIEDPSVPSHGDIKQLSKEIVTINSVDQDLVPKFITRPKYKPLKLKK